LTIRHVALPKLSDALDAGGRVRMASLGYKLAAERLQGTQLCQCAFTLEPADRLGRESRAHQEADRAKDEPEGRLDRFPRTLAHASVTLPIR
jgi:hypothetical protein